jgi:O-antigen/teichoic acid export membrane protein
VSSGGSVASVTVLDRLPTVRGRGLRALAGRAGWNLADQVVSSATNLVLSVLAARALTIEGFGAFSVAFTVYSFLIAGGRSMISRPLTVRYAAAGREGYRSAAQAALGATLVLGVVSGTTVAAVGLGMSGDLGTALVCMGVVLPGLLLQDMWRMVFITEGRPQAAFVNDLVWGVVQVGLVLGFIAADRQSAVTLLAAWGGAALVVAVLGGFQFRGRPRLRSSGPWLYAQRDLLVYYFASFVTVMGANQVAWLLIAGLGDVSDVGALRAAQVVLGPLNLLGFALAAFAVPEMARRQLSGRRAIQASAALSAVLVVADLAWGAVLIWLPDSAGQVLLGDSWTTAQEVLPASLLGLVAIGVGFGANNLMVARGFAKETFWINCLLAPGFIVFGVLGLEWGGAPGAALGLSLAQVVVAPVMWWRVLRLMRERPQRASAGADAPAAGGS